MAAQKRKKYGAVKHDEHKVARRYYRRKGSEWAGDTVLRPAIDVSVKRAGGHFVAKACIRSKAGQRSVTSRRTEMRQLFRCGEGTATGPTAALSKALHDLASSVK